MVVRRQRYHIFYTVCSQMAVRLAALRTSSPLPFPPAGRFFVFISDRGRVWGQDYNAAGRIRSVEESSYLIGNLIWDHVHGWLIMDSSVQLLGSASIVNLFNRL
jgi:hypothetical protein